ncbi:DUF86 domain-containing protein [Ornithinimicrobium sp. Y1847]
MLFCCDALRASAGRRHPGCLAVIGEGVKALPDSTREHYPDIPWASIAGLRNVVVHEYFRVDPDLILDILDHQLADLQRQLTRHS